MTRLQLVLTLLLPAAIHRGGFAQSPARDSAVYAATLDSLYPSGPGLLIRQFYRPVTETDAGQGADTPSPVALDLQTSLRAAVRSPGGALQTVLRVWRHTDWIDSSQVVVPLKNGGAEIRSAVQLSRVGYSADSRSAALYLRIQCGGLCGTERIVQLALGDDGRWRVTQVATTARF